MRLVLQKIISRYYQDALILVWVFTIHLFLQSWKRPLLATTLLLAYPANFFKLRYLKSKYEIPARNKWGHWILKALRFLAAVIVLPLFTLFTISPFIGNPPATAGIIKILWILLIFGGLWIFSERDEKGPRKKIPQPEWENRAGTLLLLLVEASGYLLLLEGLVADQSHFNISWFEFLVVLPIPFTLIYFGLLLPTHLGLMMEEYMQTGNLFKTLLRRLGHFIFLRYVPIYFIFYWRGLY